MTPHVRSVSLLVPLCLDVALVLLFAGIGRAEHNRSNPVIGVLATAWPFLLGLAVGWALLVLTTRRAPVSLREGIQVWLVTIVVGMFARQVSGDGTALAFVVVATLVLGALLLGWRALLTWFEHRRRTGR